MNEGDRVKDLRKRDYGEGAIVGHVNDGQEFWAIRWDDSGLDDEWLEEGEFEVIRAKATKVIIFPNGNVFVGDENGKQMPDTQGSWINFDYLKKLAEVVAKDRPEVLGMGNLHDVAGDSFSVYYANAATVREGEKRQPGIKARLECTCGDYPHHELCEAVQDYPDSEGKKNG